MKKLLSFLFLITVICYFGCIKTAAPDTPACTNTLPYSDSTALLKFAGDSIHPKFDSSGIFYQILDSGSASKPNGYSNVWVEYTAKFITTNAIYDSSSYSNLGGNKAGNLIGFLRFGLSKIGTGGRIKLLIPSADAYGCNGFDKVPPNTPLYFDLTLISVY
jgi:FKBP-type peptidyl-prolyl cis-trans isomerase FkpA